MWEFFLFLVEKLSSQSKYDPEESSSQKNILLHYYLLKLFQK